MPGLNFKLGDNYGVLFSESWEVLGPFQCGTREAVWGADPLEFWGGFSNLSYDEKDEYNSPLALGGTVKWGLTWPNITSLHPDQRKAEIVVGFPEVDWKFLQSIYGWSALQYQAWVRGTLRLAGSTNQTVAIYTDGVLEASIDNRRHFGGDFYSYRRAPLILELAPGEHVIELRLIRDVRALGGQGDPTVNVVLETKIQHEPLIIDERSLLIPETTNQKLGILKEQIHVAPHQIRPLVFRIATENVSSAEFPAIVRYSVYSDSDIRTQSFRIKIVQKPLPEPQRVTYLHPAGIVSYAILRPPPLDAPCMVDQPNSSLPVIIGLHGAGLEADSVEARGMLDAAYGICAWILFPSGVTSWSGDDWHTWGIADIKAAINAISHWIEAVSWNGPGILADNWIVIGHSNGGQGVWFLATHQPNNVVAAAPVSGYSSIEKYVSFNMWRDTEPLISAIIHRARSSFQHEILLGNTAGIPILQQHGSDDTNVPAYHSRLMHALLEITGWPSEYVELAGKGHWFDGVMTTGPLLKFYEDILHANQTKIPTVYTITVPSSGDMASKGGIYVDQLQSPDMVGRVQVKIDLQRGVWYLKAQNIHRFHLTASACEAERSILLVIDEPDAQFMVNMRQCDSTWYIRGVNGKWMSSRQTDWQSVSQRYGRQVGAMDAILRTNGIFTIRMCSAGIDEVALQISRNLLQYFAADSRITRQCNHPTDQDTKHSGAIPGNVITLSLRNELPNAKSSSYPIRFTDSQLLIYKGCFRANPRDDINFDNCHRYSFDYEPGMGSLFLRPLENERLELVVWGADIDGLKQAARIVPTLTGAGQPELIILSDSCRWKGSAGLYAAAHFDHSWQISSGSYISNGT
ncbi:hypothetical protein BJX63DRAFT_440522 [Aspergillus granulosus]|uniref:Peptidase S9 prolyl oligopeptidase catalytic domain-containing protein n=1 Tax=Aspergillus granulosus TaxID=176169 RepID=A0ABR4GV09_9EURO